MGGEDIILVQFGRILVDSWQGWGREMARIYHRPYHGRKKKARPGSVHSHVDPPRGWAGFARVRSTWFSTRPLFCQARNEGLLNHSPIQADTGLHPLSLSFSLFLVPRTLEREGVRWWTRTRDAKEEEGVAPRFSWISSRGIFFFLLRPRIPLERHACISLEGEQVASSISSLLSCSSSHGFFQRGRMSLSFPLANKVGRGWYF